jgi:hypothetical protein
MRRAVCPRARPNGREVKLFAWGYFVASAVAAERRAIKKSARRHLKRQLLAELDESD